MENSSASKLIAAFVLLIIGIVLVAQVADIGNDVTAKSGIASEAQELTTNGTALNTTGMIGAEYQIAESPSGWKVDDCPITNFVIANSSGSVLVEDTDYAITASNGTWYLIKTDLTTATLYPANISYATYNYCGDDYMNLSWGRTGINLVPGFFAIALLLASVGLFYSIAKENGIVS